MERCWSLDEVLRDEQSVVTVGTFDGVHQGHVSIVSFLVRRAKERSGRSVIVTFDPHPREVVHGEHIGLLTTPGERAEVCATAGVDRFVVLPFDQVLAGVSPEDFVIDVLVGRIGMKAIVVGHDHGFGRDRSGDHSLLERLGGRHGFEVDVLPAHSVRERVVSSSSIRDLLVAEGDVRLAADQLGRPYALTGTVVSGARRGRLLGFPTANVQPVDPRKVIPLAGVYAVRIYLERSGETYGAMMNIGRRPTFEESGVHLEAFLFDFTGDLYGQRLRVEFVERMRSERRFPSIEALVSQLREDEQRCRAVLRAVS